MIHDATAGVAALRDWGRWYQRCIDFGMNLPDPMVLVGALNSMTNPVISKDTEVTWRTEMVKSTLQLHARPTAEAVTAYHRHLLAEFEALATSQVPKKGGNQPSNPTLKAMDGTAGGASGGQGGGAKGGGKGKIPCKYFHSQKGCRYGGSCKNVHSMNELSKGDRFKKCLNCGSEERRAKDCDRPNKAGKTGPKEQNSKSGPQVAQVTSTPSAASTSQPIVQATPVLSPDFIQQAAEMCSSGIAGSSGHATIVIASSSGYSAITIACSRAGRQRLTAAIRHITTVHQTFGHHLPNASKLFSSLPFRAPKSGGSKPPFRGWKRGFAGARFGGTFSLRLVGLRCHTSHEYSLVWSAGSCKLYPPNGKPLRLRVKNGCPEVVESQALTLISRLEEHKLEQVEELRRRTEQGKDRIRQAKLAMDKTWWDHLIDYVSSPNTGSGQMAVSTAPFFQEVPDKALQGILPPQGVDAEPFWDAIKRALPHLNRRRRKALHQSKNWVVHLFAGAKSHKPLMKLESDDTVVLELDIQRSAAQNVYNDALWSLLLRAAREGRLAAVLGGPPCRTMSVLRHRPGGPRPVRSPAEPFGLSTLTPSERELVDHDTGLFARMLWLHATSTAGRRVHRPQPHFSSMVAFLLEQPQQVERYMAPGNPLLGEVPSWWSNPMWLSYAAEAGLFEVDFNQGPLGHVSDKPTTIGTNLPDLRDLQGLKGDPKGPWSGDSKLLAEWAPGFVKAIARALQTWPHYRLVRMTPADWEQHVANNHIPFRRDCAVCVHGSGTGRRHVGVAHPDVYCMSADVAGPIRVEGRDPESRNHRPATFKYFLAVSYRFPRLKGVKEEPDPTTAEGFEDPALLPGGTDDLADEDPIEQIGDKLLSRRPKGEAEVESREDYEDSLYQPSGGEEEDEHD